MKFHVALSAVFALNIIVSYCDMQVGHASLAQSEKTLDPEHVCVNKTVAWKAVSKRYVS